jgi:aspartate/methionine/tyrosine aminotransferase
MHLSRPALEASESLIRQIGNLAQQVDKPFKLYFGESDLRTPQFICDAAYQAMREGHTFYTPTNGYLELRQAIVEKFEEVHRARYQPSEVVCTAGGVMAIAHTMRALVDRGDNAIVVQPGWPVFDSILTLQGAEARYASLVRKGDRYELDLTR